MRFISFVAALIAAAVFTSSNLCRAQQITVHPDHTNGVYQTGNTVRWLVDLKDGSNAPPAHYRLLKGGLTEAGHGDLVFTNSAAEIDSAFDAPGTMLVEVTWKPEEGKERRTTAGAAADPERIAISAPCPADFDDFWKAKLKELKKVSAHPQLESVDIGKTNISYWKITMANIRGTHIQGQIARPATGRKFPALLIVQWAGIYPLQRSWVTERAAEGWLALDIEAHDLPIDKPASFYKDQFSGPLKDYWSIGNDDRETSYFLRMYLSCYRAAEYLRQRADWDGKTLVVMGDSQGGMQSLMLAGLDPHITAAVALVPAGCDMLGPLAGRAPGWPHWYSNTEGGKDPAIVHQASRYYDIPNFALRIKCPVLVGLGLRDETCPPAGVFAAVNQVRAPKQVVILPRSGHQDEHGTQAAFNQARFGSWLPALRQGKPAPIAP